MHTPTIPPRHSRGADLRKNGPKGARLRKPYSIAPSMARVEQYMELTALLSDCEHKIVRWRRLNIAACHHRHVAIELYDRGDIGKEARDERVKRCNDIEHMTQMEMLALQRRLGPGIAECKRLASLADKAA